MTNGSRRRAERRRRDARAIRRRRACPSFRRTARPSEQAAGRAHGRSASDAGQCRLADDASLPRPPAPCTTAVRELATARGVPSSGRSPRRRPTRSRSPAVTPSRRCSRGPRAEAERRSRRAGRGVRRPTPRSSSSVSRPGRRVERPASWAACRRPGGHRSRAFRSRARPADAGARGVTGHRCELVEAEPEQSLPTLRSAIDLVIADEWQHQPSLASSRSTARISSTTRSSSCCRRTTRQARRHRRAVPLAELAGEPWTTGHRETRSGWGEEVIVRTCRELGGFEPDIRHRTNDSVTSLALVAAGPGGTLLPAARPGPRATRPGVAVGELADRSGSAGRCSTASTSSGSAASSAADRSSGGEVSASPPPSRTPRVSSSAGPVRL